MPTFYLHLGMHKTGSTALQDFLARNRDLAATAGIAVPDLPHNNHSVFLESQFHPNRAFIDRKHARFGHVSYANEREALTERFDAFLADSAAAGLDVLVSGEDASFLGREGYASLRERVGRHYDRVVALALVRPPVSFARSAASERLKGNNSLPQIRAHPPLPRYRDRFGPALQVFGRDNVRLHPFRKDRLVDGDVLQTVLGMIDRDTAALAGAKAPQRNESLSEPGAKLLSVLNEALRHRRWPAELPEPLLRQIRGTALETYFSSVIDDGKDHLRFTHLLVHPLVEVDGPRFRLPRSIAEAVREQAAEDLAWVGEMMGEDLAALDDQPTGGLDGVSTTTFEPEEIEALAAALQKAAKAAKRSKAPIGRVVGGTRELGPARHRRFRMAGLFRRPADVTRSCEERPAEVTRSCGEMMLTFRDVPVFPFRVFQRADVGTASRFVGGPLWPDWENQTVARLCRKQQPADVAPAAMPIEETLDDPGAFWIGPLYFHFGHALQDYLTRVPESLAARPDSTLVFGAVANGQVATLADAPRWFRQILDWFEVPAERVRFVCRPTLFRTLNVVPQPEQLGTPPRADYLDRLDTLLARKSPPPAPVDHLYVSRAKQATCLVGESYLETVLAACGARVLRPEAHPIAEQLDAYRSARHIVFAEGSAIHGLQLLGRGIGDVDVLCRRARKRIGAWLAEPRARSLAYHDVVVSQLKPVKASGQIAEMLALPMIDVDRIKDLLERRGLPIRRHWDDAAWSAAAEEDVREWLSFIARRNMLADEEQREQVRGDLEKSPFPHLADLVRDTSTVAARGGDRSGRRLFEKVGARPPGARPRQGAGERAGVRVPLSHRPPPVVVGATGGSGTRAFQAVLVALDVYMGAHLNDAGDALDIEPFFNRWVNKLAGANQRIDYEWDSLDPDLRARAVAALKRRLNQYLAPCPRETRWGWKSPRSIWTLPVIEQTVPGFRFLHVLRDGRDMAFAANINQFRRHSGALFGAPKPAAEDADGPALARLWSAVNGQAADWAERHLGERYLRVRLEDLCADPRGTVERIARWLALDPSQEELARAAGIVQSPSSLGRWREAPAPEIKAIAAAASGSLERFGYAAA